MMTQKKVMRKVKANKKRKKRRSLRPHHVKPSRKIARQPLLADA